MKTRSPCLNLLTLCGEIFHLTQKSEYGYGPFIYFDSTSLGVENQGQDTQDGGSLVPDVCEYPRVKEVGQLLEDQVETLHEEYIYTEGVVEGTREQQLEHTDNLPKFSYDFSCRII